MAIRTREETSCYVGQVSNRSKALEAIFSDEFEHIGVTQYRWKARGKVKTDQTSYPECVTDAPKYKQLGNSVTRPFIEEMARFISVCMETLCKAIEPTGGIGHDK